MQKNIGQPSFSSVIIAGRKIKSQFFDQMNLLLDWTAIEAELNKHYHKGYSVAGRPSYSALLLFKMLLLQTWYGLSDYEVEERVNDSLSFMAFTGLSLEDPVPDNTVLSRFRTALVQKGALEKLFRLINSQLETKGILHKAARNKPLSVHQVRFNKLISKTRYRVERTFGGMSLWFRAGTARYVGQAKTHAQHLMEAMAYNLYRAPGIVASNAYLLV